MTRGLAMLILYVALKHDYGLPAHGPGFEHHNFFDSLRGMGHDILYYDFMTAMRVRGRDEMNRRLLEVAKSERPRLMFTCLFTDQFDGPVIRAISERGETVTLNWFCDDHWRFDNFSRHWAPCFNWVVTTSQEALDKYRAIGYTGVIKSQWACNHWLYRRLDLPLAHDVTFVGQPHGNRRDVLRKLRRAGFNVRAWGSGWKAGRISQEEMIRVFNQSRINLNLSNAFTARSPLLSRLNQWMSKLVRRGQTQMPAVAPPQQIKGATSRCRVAADSCFRESRRTSRTTIGRARKSPVFRRTT